MSVLQCLRHLSLAQNARITDASLLVLSNLTTLTFLNLSQSKLTGNGIQHLQSLQVWRPLGALHIPLLLPWLLDQVM